VLNHYSLIKGITKLEPNYILAFRSIMVTCVLFIG